MSFFLEILLYQLIFIFLIPLLYIIGTIATSILCIKNNNDNTEHPFNFYLDIFYKTFTGIIIITVFAALFFTGSKTILSGFLLVIIFFIYENKWLLNKKFSIKFFQPISLNTIIRIIIFAELFFLFSCIKICDYYNLCFVPGYTDYIFLSKLSESLVLTGVENYFTGEKILTPIEYNFAIPYHYFDLWFNGIISKLFNTNNYITHELVTNNVLLTISFLGLVALLNQFRFKVGYNWLVSLLILLLMNIGLLRFPVYEKFFFLMSMPYKIRYLGENWMYFPKLIQLIPFVISGIIFLYQSKYVNCYLVLMATIFVYQTLFPVIVGALFLFGIYIYARKEISWIVFRKIIIYKSVLVLFFLIFYKSFGLDSYSNNSYFDFSESALEKFWKDLLPGIYQFFVFNGPWFLIGITLFYINKKQLKENNFLLNSFVLYVLIILMGFISWLLLILNPDSPQLIGNSIIIAEYILASMLLWLVVVFLSTNYKKLKLYTGRVAILSLILLLLYRIVPNVINAHSYKLCKSNKYSIEYRAQIKLLEPAITNPVGVFIMTQEEYEQDMELASILGYGDNKSDVLAFYPRMLNTINLGVFGMPLPDNSSGRQQQIHANEQNIFYKFVQKQKQENKFISIEKSQVDFIQYYNIQYLICTKNTVLNPSLELLIKSKAIDDNSEEIFCLLNV